MIAYYAPFKKAAVAVPRFAYFPRIRSYTTDASSPPDTLSNLGHGIKDMGIKETLLILEKDDMAMDMRAALLEESEFRWAKPTTIA